jgi:hypothetical protein
MQERGYHGTPVDRKHGLRPALGQRPHAPSLAGSQHNCFERHADIACDVRFQDRGLCP